MHDIKGKGINRIAFAARKGIGQCKGLQGVNNAHDHIVENNRCQQRQGDVANPLKQVRTIDLRRLVILRGYILKAGQINDNGLPDSPGSDQHECRL